MTIYIKKINFYIDKVVGMLNQTIAASTIFLGVFVAFVNVISRYLFNSSITWAAELTIYLFIWSTFFGSAYCFKTNSHIGITILLDKLPPNMIKLFSIMSHIITFLFLISIAYLGILYIGIIEGKMTDDLGVPMWIPYMVVPIAFFSASYRVLEKIFETVYTPADKILLSSETNMILNEKNGK
jgi:C4-dicarboxylate transporter DctQ subunit